MTAVERAVQGQDAVLCALGAASPLRRDRTLIEGVQPIVDAMTRYGTRRLVYLSFLGVLQGRAQLSVIGRTVVAPLLHNVVADHEAKERIVQQSGLEWVIVRPPRLINGPRRGTFRHGPDIRATSIIPTISRADVADFMLARSTTTGTCIDLRQSCIDPSHSLLKFAQSGRYGSAPVTTEYDSRRARDPPAASTEKSPGAQPRQKPARSNRSDVYRSSDQPSVHDGQQAEAPRIRA